MRLLLLLLACRTPPLPYIFDLAVAPRDLSQLPDLQAPDDLSHPPCPALSLDGMSNATAPPIGVAPASFTVEAWLYLSYLQGGVVAAAADPTSDVGPFYLTTYDGGGINWGVNGEPLGGNQLDNDAALTTAKWSHYAGVFDAGSQTVSMFLDGAQVNSATTALMELLPSPAPLFIGMLPPKAAIGFGLDGYLAELRLSSTARYSGTFVPERRFVSDDATMALYHFDEAGGSIAHDDSPNHNDATLLNNARFASPPECL